MNSEAVRSNKATVQQIPCTTKPLIRFNGYFVKQFSTCPSNSNLFCEVVKRISLLFAAAIAYPALGGLYLAGKIFSCGKTSGKSHTHSINKDLENFKRCVERELQYLIFNYNTPCRLCLQARLKIKNEIIKYDMPWGLIVESEKEKPADIFKQIKKDLRDWLVQNHKAGYEAIIELVVIENEQTGLLTDCVDFSLFRTEFDAQKSSSNGIPTRETLIKQQGNSEELNEWLKITNDSLKLIQIPLIAITEDFPCG